MTTPSPTAYKVCPQCQTKTEIDAAFCSKCGRQYRTKFPPQDDKTTFVNVPPVSLGQPPQDPQRPILKPGAVNLPPLPPLHTGTAQQLANIAATQKDELQKKINKWIGGVAGVFVVLFVLGKIMSATGADNTKNDAYYMSQTFVKRALKSPSSADFPPYEERYVEQVDKITYDVIGWVEAKNSFGVQIRELYTCRLHYAGNSQWICDRVHLNE